MKRNLLINYKTLWKRQSWVVVLRSDKRNYFPFVQRAERTTSKTQSAVSFYMSYFRVGLLQWLCGTSSLTMLLSVWSSSLFPGAKQCCNCWTGKGQSLFNLSTGDTRESWSAISQSETVVISVRLGFVSTLNLLHIFSSGSNFTAAGLIYLSTSDQCGENNTDIPSNCHLEKFNMSFVFTCYSSSWFTWISQSGLSIKFMFQS